MGQNFMGGRSVWLIYQLDSSESGFDDAELGGSGVRQVGNPALSVPDRREPVGNRKLDRKSVVQSCNSHPSTTLDNEFSSHRNRALA